MGLEDIAMFRAIHGSVVLHLCDGNQTAKLVAAMADHDGIAYIRTLRPATGVIYLTGRGVRGGSCVLRSSDDDEVALVAAGITVSEALRAAEQLGQDGIAARVIDLYSISFTDVETLMSAAETTGGRIVTVEDHWSEGGPRRRRALRARRLRAATARRKARRAGNAQLGKSRRSCSQRPVSTPTIAEAARRLVRQTVQTA